MTPVREDQRSISTCQVLVQPMHLPGVLRLPESARGVVAFAHGSGSSRLSARNNYVADRLSHAGIASLLFDLLDEEEELDRRNVFDIDLLAQRLNQAVTWLVRNESTHGLPIGLFGASTGAAAALAAAADARHEIAAIVSRGGRPDLAGDFLDRVRAPTLLIVGALDHEVLAWNESAYAQLQCVRQLEVVPGATHLFAEQGALERVVCLSQDWFQRFFI